MLDQELVGDALNGRLATWASDEDDVRRAERRRADALETLAPTDVAASGRGGDGDLLVATENALRISVADEMVIAAHPEGRSNWLAHHITVRARASYSRPVDQIVVETDRREHFAAA